MSESTDQPTTETRRYADGGIVRPPQRDTIVSMPPTPRRTDKWLRALGIIALVEAIILMTAAIILGLLTVVLGASLLNKAGDTPLPGIDPGAGDYTNQELQDYQANPEQFCADRPGHPLCP